MCHDGIAIEGDVDWRLGVGDITTEPQCKRILTAFRPVAGRGKRQGYLCIFQINFIYEWHRLVAAMDYRLLGVWGHKITDL